jgi:hypothetical protein
MPQFIQIGYQTFPVQNITTSSCTGSIEIAAGGVISAGAFGKFAAVAPGSWIEIYGTNLATDTRGWETADFQGVDAPISLDGTSVTIGGQAAFVDYISSGQVNAQIPSNVGLGSQQVIVSTPNGSTAPYTVNVNATNPGLLAPTSFNVNGTQYAAALFSDGKTFVLPPGAIPGLTSRRAKPGDTITLYDLWWSSTLRRRVISIQCYGSQCSEQRFRPANLLSRWSGGNSDTIHRHFRLTNIS